MDKLKIFTVSTIVAFILSSFAVAPVFNPLNSMVVTGTGARAAWKKDVHNFGEIPQGKPVTVEFIFSNEGDAALVINDVGTPCECTVPDYPKEPIAPGKTAKIKVTYNAANKGVFSKVITVRSNAQEASKALTIKGTVK